MNKNCLTFRAGRSVTRLANDASGTVGVRNSGHDRSLFSPPSQLPRICIDKLIRASCLTNPCVKHDQNLCCCVYCGLLPSLHIKIVSLRTLLHLTQILGAISNLSVLKYRCSGESLSKTYIFLISEMKT